MRRAVAALVLATALVAAPARAGTYLDAAALLLDETRRSADWVQSHAMDKALCAVAHQLAEERVRVARGLAVPREAERAHPHFLLALEIAERALAAAADGDLQRFLRLVTQARDEERTLRSVLDQLKLKLPELDRKR